MTRGEPDPEVIRRHLAALREALSNLLDIATHLAAAAGLDSPDYATAIDRLAELSVLPAAFAACLRPIAGLRNILVHGYLQVDLEILERVLNQRLGDLEEFAVCVDAHLARA